MDSTIPIVQTFAVAASPELVVTLPNWELATPGAYKVQTRPDASKPWADVSSFTTTAPTTFSWALLSNIRLVKTT